MTDVATRVEAHLSGGDGAAAATAAIEGYGPAILGYLCSLLDADDARDAFSMFSEDLWRGLPGFRGECSLRAWAYRLAWHAAARLMRDRYRRHREPLPSSAASRLAASVAASTALGGRRERLRRLRASLGPEEQTLLVLRVDRELEWEEIAAVLAGAGRPAAPAALRKRFERLKEKLARRAREEGLLD